MSSNYTGGQILAAFLGGAAAGAAVAALTTPKSGPEARRQMKGYVDDTRKQVEGYVHDRAEEAAKLPDAVRAASSAAKEAFNESLEDSPKRLRPLSSSNEDIHA
ncbi:MAG: YtxH domain-containing protein [Myxococcales bacterium]|nr:YtxH domain-containing protein [Myxococcales bacterium]